MERRRARLVYQGGTILRNELRHAVRRLLASPGFALAVIAILALGIGVNTAVFSVVNSILLHPPGVHGPAQVAALRVRYDKLNLKSIPVSTPDFDDVHNRTDVFSAAAIYGASGFSYANGGQPLRLRAARVSQEWFRVFGVNAALGRTFRSDEDAPNRNYVVVLEHSAWRRLFGGDPAAIGRTMLLDGKPYRVIGVMPAEFSSVTTCDLWVPFALPPEEHTPGNRFNEGLVAVARIRPNVSFDKASAVVRLLSGRVRSDKGRAGEYARDSAWGMFLVPWVEFSAGEMRTPVLILMGAVALVLMIACSNIAGLLLARASGRTREIAVRAALGAGRWHVVRGLLLETALLAVVGCIAGVALSLAAVRGLQALAPEQQAAGLSVTPDLRVLLFAIGASAFAAMLFGLLPSIQIARLDFQSVLREGGRTGTAGRSRTGARQALIAAEFAIALVLIAGAGLLLRSFARLESVQPGFNPHGVITGMAALPDNLEREEDRLTAFHEAVINRLRSTPGVHSAAAAVGLPFSDINWSASFLIEGREVRPGDPGPHGDRGFASPDYFSVLGIPLLQGRFFTDLDRKGSEPVCIIDDVLARQYWPDEDPLGKRIHTGRAEAWWRIVGIVGHVRRSSLAMDSNKGVYYQPLWQQPLTAVQYVARAESGNAAALAPAIRDAVRDVDPSQAAFDLQTMDERIAESLGTRRFALTLVSSFALIALLLAAVGIYALINYSVSQRTQEIGIRMALGAERGAVLSLILREGLMLAGSGAAVGIVVAALLARLVRSQLFGIGASDPLTFAGAMILLGATALIACLVPARRAMAVDPAIALRNE